MEAWIHAFLTLAVDGSEYLFLRTSHVTHEERALDRDAVSVTEMIWMLWREILPCLELNPGYLAHDLVAVVTEPSQKFCSDFNKVFLLFYSYDMIW